MLMFVAFETYSSIFYLFFLCVNLKNTMCIFFSDEFYRRFSSHLRLMAQCKLFECSILWMQAKHHSHTSHLIVIPHFSFSAFTLSTGFFFINFTLCLTHSLCFKTRLKNDVYRNRGKKFTIVTVIQWEKKG